MGRKDLGKGRAREVGSGLIGVLQGLGDDLRHVLEGLGVEALGGVDEDHIGRDVRAHRLEELPIFMRRRSEGKGIGRRGGGERGDADSEEEEEEGGREAETVRLGRGRCE